MYVYINIRNKYQFGFEIAKLGLGLRKKTYWGLGLGILSQIGFGFWVLQNLDRTDPLKTLAMCTRHV